MNKSKNKGKYKKRFIKSLKILMAILFNLVICYLKSDKAHRVIETLR